MNMYNYEYEDFYEPSQYDELVEEFKEELRKSVVREWVDKMNALKEENESLQEIKKNFEAIKTDYEIKKAELENAKLEVKSMRLKELISDARVEFWAIEKKGRVKPKCDKCDSHREISFISPLGRAMKEICECGISEKYYVPKCITLYKIRINSYDKKGDVDILFRCEDTNEMYATSYKLSGNHVVNDTESFADLDDTSYWYYFFTSKERCQEYCDYLTSKEDNDV